MEYHRISFIHDDTEYSFIKAMNAGLTGYDLMKACRVEVTIYMKENNLKGRYIPVSYTHLDVYKRQPIIYLFIFFLGI